MKALVDETHMFWGKARSGCEDDASSWHPAIYHLLDVTACAKVLLPAFAPQIEQEWRALALFLVALHDIGKFTRSFQALSRLHWPTALLGAFVPPPAAGRHDTLGYRLLTEPLRRELEACMPGWRWDEIQPFLRAVTGHHGRPPLEGVQDYDLSPKVFCPACRAAAVQVLHEMQGLLLPDAPPALRPAAAKQLSWSLAGLATLADWIGSARLHFPYTAPMEGGLAAYWSLALERAARAVAAAGVMPAASMTERSLLELFPTEIKDPTPVQKWAGTVELPPGPMLALIEDVTGSGKTEAAVLLAHRLIAAGRANGLFFALPTMATADAMFARLGAAYRKLFAPAAHPSLVLAHGRRGLHAGFHEAVLRSLRPESDEVGEEPAGAECAAWIAEDRRLAFLADVGAGTIDQALLGILPSRHAALRLLGLARKVVVVDEAHAYDSYMQGELEALLRFQAALGGSAVVLSATLPRAMRASLAGAFAAGLGAPAPELRHDNYPLTTLIAAAGATEAACGARAESHRKVTVRRLSSEGEALDALIGAAALGAAAVWVRNTVDDAIAATEALQSRGLSPILFHARYAMGDRQRIQAEVLKLFGKNSVSKQRSGQLLVATQVVEQSLDLDFDLVVSDLAPVDLLVQRAGRLWRHSRRRDPRIAGPELLVLSPEPVADPPTDWVRNLLPGTAAVYRDPALLWRSARALFAAGAIVTPEGVRPLIEAAYASDGEIPPALRTPSEKVQGQQTAHTHLARQNVLSLDEGYRHGRDAWDSDIRTPTRIEEETTTLRLARLLDGVVVPWCQTLDLDPQRAWALSEVTVHRKRATEGVILPEMKAAVDQARASWPEWDRTLPMLLLQDAQDGWASGMVEDGNSRLVPVCYAAQGAGLVFPPKGGMTR